MTQRALLAALVLLFGMRSPPSLRGRLRQSGVGPASDGASGFDSWPARLARPNQAARPPRRVGIRVLPYRLDVTLDDNITSYGLTADRAATQERRTLRARYQLVDLTNGLVVLDETAGSDASIDVVSSEYATVAAEQTSLENLAGIVADQIVARLAIYASRTSHKS